MIRTKGDAGTGNVRQAVDHMREIAGNISALAGMKPADIADYAASVRVPEKLIQECIELGRLPVVTFAAGGVATPADAALLMHLGADGIFVGSVSPSF